MSTEVTINLAMEHGYFLPMELIFWLHENIGEVANSHGSCAVGDGWYLKKVYRTSYYAVLERCVFVIDDANKALMFKLRWG